MFRNLFKNKIVLAGAAVTLAAGVILSAVFLSKPGKSPPLQAEGQTSSTTSGFTVDVPSATDNAGTTITDADTVPSPGSNPAVLDVGGNPGSTPGNYGGIGSSTNPEGNSTGGGSTGGGNSGGTGGVSPPTQKPPQVDVTVTPDGEQPKDDKPNPKPPKEPNYPSNPDDWTPPPPGQGTGDLISDGLDKIPISNDKKTEVLYSDIGMEVGNKLLNAGYNTIYPDAGSTRQMAEDAAKNYAETGSVSINPAKYGLPKLVGEYHAKLAVKGNNAAEAAEYIFQHIKNDKVWNDKVNTVFGTYKDGFLTVYQKDGYFYILFAVIDQGYMG